jgi:tRNA dimethylallyltransferase
VPTREHEEKTLVVVIGPTSSGKSALALELACQFGAEIVNCDSVQVYKGFNIGSAKTPEHKRRGIPHHLFDAVGPGEHFSAGDYLRAARAALASISSANRLPIVCGGTGFYLRTLLHGLAAASPRNECLRGRLRKISKRRPAALHRLLRRLDEDAALRIHWNDHQKLIRAIEIASSAKVDSFNISMQARHELQGHAVLKIGLNPERDLLHQQINQRCERMFLEGLLEETRELLRAGYCPDSKPMQSLGYRQAVQVIHGELTIDEAIKGCQLKTRQYAKRQMTWFRSESGVHWLAGFGTELRISAEAHRLVEHALVRSQLNVTTF